MADLAIVVLGWFFVVWFVVAVIWTALYVLRLLRLLRNSYSFHFHGQNRWDEDTWQNQTSTPDE
jgi:hypothetical protein